MKTKQTKKKKKNQDSFRTLPLRQETLTVQNYFSNSFLSKMLNPGAAGELSYKLQIKGREFKTSSWPTGGSILFKTQIACVLRKRCCFKIKNGETTEV